MKEFLLKSLVKRIEDARLNNEAAKFAGWYLKNAVPHLKGMDSQNAANYAGAGFINGVRWLEEQLGVKKDDGATKSD
jgi:hypothetical protein